MRPEVVFAHIGPVPYMKLQQAKLFYDFITTNHLENCLELGFCHGVSTAYIAGAIQDLGTGRLTSIDRTTAIEQNPNVESVLAAVGLSKFVHLFYEPRSFNWRLMKFLEEGRNESFDFCYIDGGHSWYDTGFAFCLVERLLKRGGWVVFDDLDYTFRRSPSQDKQWVRRMPEEEQVVPQVGKVFELLVEADPLFGDFRRIGSFGFARKQKPTLTPQQRYDKAIEIVVSAAVTRARYDSEFRALLLSSPERALSGFSSKSADAFRHVSFFETDHGAPIPSEINEQGSTVIFLGPLER
jgi:predicted O-methyltransferase YrrM